MILYFQKITVSAVVFFCYKRALDLVCLFHVCIVCCFMVFLYFVMNQYRVWVENELRDRDEKFAKEIKRFNPSIQYSSYWREWYYIQMKSYLSRLVAPRKFEDMTVIELGSWSGKATFNLAPQKAVLVDISSNALEFAALINASWYKVDAQYIQDDFLHYQDEKKYDFVFNIWTLEHYDDDSIVHMIQQMISLVEDDGYVCFWVPNRFSWPILKAWFLSTRIWKCFKWYRLDSERFFTNTKMKSLIKRAVHKSQKTLCAYKVGYVWSPCIMESSPRAIQRFDRNLGKWLYRVSFLKLYSFKIWLKNKT